MIRGEQLRDGQEPRRADGYVGAHGVSFLSVV